MSFGGFRDSSTAGARVVAEISYSSVAAMPTAPMSPPRVVASSLQNPMLSSPGLSLALQTSLEGVEGTGTGGGGPDEMIRRIAGIGDFDTNFGGRGAAGKANGNQNREEDYETRSGSDNMEGGFGDDLDPEHLRKKKRYHRHTPEQIQLLEELFKECPHPDEKQRMELSKRLCLESRQVKFWFQNRRTQMKTQMERHVNALLRQENEKLKMENMTIREAMRNPMCQSCDGPAALGEISVEQQQLRLENARLRNELDRVTALAGRFVGRPTSRLVAPLPPHMADSSLELAGGNGFGGLCHVPPAFPPALGVIPGISGALAAVDPPPVRPLAAPVADIDRSLERSLLADLALVAMEELVKKAQAKEPLWVRDGDGREVLNEGEYLHAFSQCLWPKQVGFVTEATRETGMVIINSLALVETLMDANRWRDMFPSVIAKASTADVICTGMGGTRNGVLQLMRAELQVLTPLVPVREVSFLRFCKEHAQGVWAVVDVSLDAVRDNSARTKPQRCHRLPSGCMVQDMPNGYSKVTWVEHAEYDESGVHPLYRPLLQSGMALGAERWVATLQRQCQCLAILMSSVVSSHENTVPGITATGRRSMLKLARRMTESFCAGVCASSVHEWTKLSIEAVDEDVRVMTRKSLDEHRAPPGVVLSVATSVWLPVPPRRLFDFLRDEPLRSEWDILSNGGPMQEMGHIAMGHQGNAVSLLRANAGRANESSMLILQETSTDASGSLVVYAPVDIPAIHLVMDGGDSCVPLLPSGFVVLPNGPARRALQQRRGPDVLGNGDAVNGGGPAAPPAAKVGGSLLTVAIQILVNTLHTAKLDVETVESVNNLISCTLRKIRAALHCKT